MRTATTLWSSGVGERAARAELFGPDMHVRGSQMEEPIPRTEPAAAVLRGHWPADVQVFLRPGVGGERRYGGAFAPTAWHVYDELAERGVSVAYAVEDQRPDCVILLESADWWGPVLLLARDLGVGVVGTAIYAGLKRIIFGAREELGDGLRAHLDV